ncbi:MAG: Fic family protein [Candidatus Woesearchaeota archaeon]|nr:Fic family protein [Candidatus Woesearchaeota archaeon]
MVSIVTRKVKGNDYLYLVETFREAGKVKQRTLKYIGKKRPVPKEELVCMQRSHAKEDWILTKMQDHLSYQDHAAMKNASKQQEMHLQRLDKTTREKERERFLSAFITSSNAIEGSTMTKKETYEYLFQDVTPAGHSKKELYMAENLLAAWKYLEKHCKKFPKEHDLLALHTCVNNRIERATLGKYKKVQNYVGDVYTTSYLYVPERMKELFLWIKKAFKKIDDFEVAFQSHAQFELIHPFVDGNGRVGRLLLNWLLMYKELSPLIITKRGKYLEALQNAQRGKLVAICQFCYRSYAEQYRFA